MSTGDDDRRRKREAVEREFARLREDEDRADLVDRVGEEHERVREGDEEPRRARERDDAEGH